MAIKLSASLMADNKEGLSWNRNPRRNHRTFILPQVMFPTIVMADEAVVVCYY